MPLQLHKKFVKFTLENMLHFDKNCIKEKEQDVKIQPSKKFTYCGFIPLQSLLSAHHCISIWHMDKKMVVDVFKNEEILQFQVGYMFYPDLNQNKVFKPQVKNMGLIFEKNNLYPKNVEER